jgi:hypothetical protein
MSDHSRVQTVILTTVVAVSKQTTHRFHMESLNMKKLNEVQGKVEHHVEISNRFTV